MGAGRQGSLKILIVLTYYHPHTTGLTQHAKSLAEAMARRGHQVTVAASRHDASLPKAPQMLNGVRVVRLWAPIRLSRGMVMPTFPWRILQLMRQHDIVSIHTPMLETALISLLGRIAGVSIVPTHHGDLFLPDGWTNQLIIKMMYFLFAFMARRAPAIVGYSEDYRENSYYLRPFREKVEAIYPPVSIPAPEPGKAAALRRLWQVDDGPLIGFSGRFAHEKRPDLLIQSLAVINRDYPNARIVFAGEYEINYESTWRKHKALVEKHKEQLIFLGLLDDRQALANFYAACDVVVIPSNNECMGLAQIEAMLCGTPVVMSDIYGGRVPVQVTGMGKLSQQGDWRSIGETTMALLRERDKFVKSREFIADCFSMETTIGRYEAVLRRHAIARPSR